MFLCHTKTDANAAIQRRVKRVLWEDKKEGSHRFRSSLWWWNRPKGEVSTMVSFELNPIRKALIFMRIGLLGWVNLIWEIELVAVFEIW